MRKCVWARSTVDAARQAELKVNTAKDPEIGVPLVTEVVVVDVYVWAVLGVVSVCVSEVDASEQMSPDPEASRC